MISQKPRSQQNGPKYRRRADQRLYAHLHIYCTDDDILRFFDPSIPDEPVEPDTPVEPEVPTKNIGSISEDNSIVIDETQLENGIYTLRYIDSNENVIDNFNEITSFEINN